MKSNNTKKFFYAGLLYSIILFACPAQAQQAATEVLDDVVIKQSNYNAVIKVLFKRPVAYLSHSPESNGNTINVRITLPGILSRNVIGLLRSESIHVNSDTGLNEVVFENISNSSSSILLYFSKNVSYDVIQGNDQRSLSIVIYGLD